MPRRRPRGADAGDSRPWTSPRAPLTPIVDPEARHSRQPFQRRKMRPARAALGGHHAPRCQPADRGALCHRGGPHVAPPGRPDSSWRTASTGARTARRSTSPIRPPAASMPTTSTSRPAPSRTGASSWRSTRTTAAPTGWRSTATASSGARSGTGGACAATRPTGASSASCACRSRARQASPSEGADLEDAVHYHGTHPPAVACPRPGALLGRAFPGSGPRRRPARIGIRRQMRAHYPDSRAARPSSPAGPRVSGGPWWKPCARKACGSGSSTSRGNPARRWPGA